MTLSACGASQDKPKIVDAQGREVSAATLKAAEAEIAARKAADTLVGRQAERIARNADFRRRIGKDAAMTDMEKAVLRKASSDVSGGTKTASSRAFASVQEHVMVAKRKGSALGRSTLREERRRRGD